MPPRRRHGMACFAAYHGLDGQLGSLPEKKPTPRKLEDSYKRVLKMEFVNIRRLACQLCCLSGSQLERKSMTRESI